MSKTVTVSLGGVSYEVPMLNIGQIRRLSKSTSDPFAILEIALERATPKLDKPFDELEVPRDEIADAVSKLMVLSGFQADRPNGEAPAQEPGA